MIHPQTGEQLIRDTRPVRISSHRFPGYQETVELTGWYGQGDDFPILEGEDWNAYNAAIARMKANGEDRS